LLEAWESAFGGTPQTSAHVLLKASAPGALREVLSVVASKPNGELDSKRLGRFLSKFEDRIIDGRAFRRASTGRVAKWFLDRGGMNRNGVAPANALNLTEQVTLEIDAEGTQGAATCLP
jgi:hypothetical protein